MQVIWGERQDGGFININFDGIYVKEVHVLSVEQSESNAPADAAEKRRESVRKAETQSKLINQLNFASGSKWRDYDVDVEKLMERREKKEEDELPGA
jgi:hypothetical protein